MYYKIIYLVGHHVGGQRLVHGRLELRRDYSSLCP